MDLGASENNTMTDFNNELEKWWGLWLNGLTTTTNGAVVPISTGDPLIDQFGRAGSFRDREYSEVAKDMETLWEANPENALKFVLYLRMITRVIRYNQKKTSEKLQKGQGARDESFKRLLWISQKAPEVFYKNLWLIPLVGSWKDLWSLMVMADSLKLEVNKNVFYALLKIGLQEKTQQDLVLKFMPRIKTKSNINTDRALSLTLLAKEFAEYLNLTPRQYNKLKHTGAAHLFQRQMCDQDYEAMEWNKIPGIALGKLTAGKFFTKHDLVDSYMEWLEKQGNVKFNGYPYDLMMRLTSAISKNRGYGEYSSYDLLERRIMDEVPEIVKKTTDLQFKNLIDKIQGEGKWNENVLCALDTSGSMSWGHCSGKVKPIDVCLSLGIYFSTLNQGHFHKKVMMFDSVSRVKQLEGSFTEMVSQIQCNAMGSTNFESIIDELVNYRKQHPNVPLEEYCSTILVVSDMQFNSMVITYSNDHRRRYNEKQYTPETYYDHIKRKLLAAFPKDFVDNMKFIWWNVNGSHENQPASKDDKGCIFLSGMDGAAISFVLGVDQEEKPEKKMPIAEEVVQNALSQEILQYATI